MVKHTYGKATWLHYQLSCSQRLLYQRWVLQTYFLTDCSAISADVYSGEDKIFICFSNLWSLLSIARQINLGWDFLLHLQVRFLQSLAWTLTLVHNSRGTHFHNLCWIIMGVATMASETKQTYKQSYHTVLSSAHLIFKLPAGWIKVCSTCAAVLLSCLYAPTLCKHTRHVRHLGQWNNTFYKLMFHWLLALAGWA